MVSGLPAQFNRRHLGYKVKLHVWSADGPERVIRTAVLEEPGAWCFPPIAAAVTAGMRFLTYLASALAEAKGGAVLYVATDSLAIVSTPEGGFVSCEGGPAIGIDPETGSKAHGWHALSFTAIEEIREAMQTFSPYADGPLLRLEPENFSGADRRQAYMLAVSPMRAYVYVLNGEEGS
jgi:hypothetical protein